ncbi:YqaA family protein [Roseinatronobacter bogoriensis]|uniref:DedA family protein n=1 Tax=Roseinatronobacter bogoriensis subsp. barguzinensis TaxID=441209 RepID=A0A2K8KB24_9RHOB|nr:MULTISPECIES: YqaA family protein [Rhodobaca]ATX66642.1 DedA family protein [Rhodobaca barguzinensis]MBB4207822.1 membrane protein YqaA with SNARE-associated domain [Rhodobaca bogoriensis DSM 18756]TDW39872.1 membrane protein YqaA with SNARE-associated domain [Rhodobaca barguzinensis]TDY70975.1 membrane protein YqaA with SNARE-associated domain [Rhodobaca bogoriensis DSM 18756]
MITLTALVTLFAAAFLAATIIPFQSEAVFVALQLGNVTGLVLLVGVASLGNTLGAFVNYAVGMRVETYRDRRWFPMRPEQLERTQIWFRRYGVWSLLFSWAPVLGWFTLVAGVMRTPLWQFALLVAIAKTGRYAVLAWLTSRAMVLVA